MADKETGLTVAQLIARLKRVKDKSILVAFENTGQTIYTTKVDRVDLSTEKRLWLFPNYN